MDPDAALATALTATDSADRSDATIALRGWLVRGGFPPREAVVRDAGIDRRMPLPCSHGKIYLERYRDGWCITIGHPDGTRVFYRLRRN